MNRAPDTDATKFVNDVVSHTAKILRVKASFFLSNIPSSGEMNAWISCTDLNGTNLSRSKESVSIENWKMTFLS